MIDFTEEEKSSLDSFSFRSILNLEQQQSNNQQPSKNVTKKPPMEAAAAANLASFYLTPNENELEEEYDELATSHKNGVNDHFKSVHIPSDDLVVEQSNKRSSGQQNESAKETSSAGIELDTVKHKLSSIWNNVKYGWSNYLKKPNKIDLDKNEEIIILGKRFNQSDMIADDSEAAREVDMSKSFGNSSFYFYPTNNDNVNVPPPPPMTNNSMDMEKNYSIIHKPNTSDEYYESKPPLTTTTAAKPVKSATNNSEAKSSSLEADYISMTYSYLSSSSIFSNLLPKSLSSDSLTNKAANRTRNMSNTNNNDEQLIKWTNDKMRTRLEQEIYSRLWFTYRKDFEALCGANNTKYTSDCGWGCMLSAAQMLIAQGLVRHAFGRDWSLYTSLTTRASVVAYREIVSLFADRFDPAECPLGIHNLLSIADRSEHRSGNDSTAATAAATMTTTTTSRVGTWFGPTSVCHLMRDAVNSYRGPSQLLSEVRVYVAQDCTVFRQDVVKLCSHDDGFRPCIMLVPVRLGGESINEIYVDSLRMFFQMDNCIGMIGGRPKHSLYFIGYQNEKVIYLDPHLCQPTVKISSKVTTTVSESRQPATTTATAAPNTSESSLSPAQQSNKQNRNYSNTLHAHHHNHHYRHHPPHFHRSTSSSSSSISSSSTATTISSPVHNFELMFDNSSYHCTHPNKIEFSKLDPSLAVGFYCRTLDELNQLCDFIKKSSESEYHYPIFGVSEDTYEKMQLNYENFLLDENNKASAFETPNVNSNGSSSGTSSNGGRSRSSTGGSKSTIKSQLSESSTEGAAAQTPARTSKHLKAAAGGSSSSSSSSKHHLKSKSSSSNSSFLAKFKGSRKGSTSGSTSGSNNKSKKGESDDFVLV